MKRSRGQEVPSQEARSKMSRHDLVAIEETETPTTNIFLVETVLRRLFKQIESVSMLKELRRMCQLWDKVDTEELEERAFQGLFKPIKLIFCKRYDKFKPIKDSLLEMRGFLDDTFSNPHLFRSFTIIFPGSLALLNLYKFRWFHKDYSPTFLELDIPYDIQFNQDKEELLKELLRWAAPTLRELIFRNVCESDQIPTRKSLPVQSFNFPHLRKMSLILGEWPGIVEAFKAIFTKENHPETPSLTSLRLPYIFPFDFLDILNSNPSRWATLTKLEIGCLMFNNNDEQLYQFTNGLLSLARSGITLKKLDLGIRILKNHSISDGEDPQFLGTCRNLSQFFASQATSLEALKLTFNFHLIVTIGEDEEGQIKIQLPVFERLHTLSLDLDTLVYINDIHIWNIFEFGSFPHHFPALENLNILRFGGSLDAFFGGSYEVEERLNLKRIAISRGPLSGCNDNSLHFDKYFGFVEAFSCSQYVVHNLRILGDLVDTIRVLYIRDVASVLNLSQFKGLRRVVIEEEYKSGNMHWKVNKNYDRYLSYFQKVMELGLDSITFRGLDMLGKEKDFAQAFPFRVEFEDKPGDWFDKDFIEN